MTLRLSYLYDPLGNNFIQIAVYCFLKIEIFQRIILSRLDMQILTKNTFLAMFDGKVGIFHDIDQLLFLIFFFSKKHFFIVRGFPCNKSNIRFNGMFV